MCTKNTNSLNNAFGEKHSKDKAFKAKTILLKHKQFKTFV